LDREWRKLEIQMKRRITVLRNKAKANITLAEKLKLKDAIKVSEEALSQHRLNYYELTTCND